MGFEVTQNILRILYRLDYAKYISELRNEHLNKYPHVNILCVNHVEY